MPCEKVVNQNGAQHIRRVFFLAKDRKFHDIDQRVTQLMIIDRDHIGRDEIFGLFIHTVRRKRGTCQAETQEKGVNLFHWKIRRKDTALVKSHLPSF